MSRVPTPNRFFPRLTADNHLITSAVDKQYNCIAWAAGITDDWLEPGRSWPVRVGPIPFALEGLIRVYESFGYSVCDPYEPSGGYDLIAVYADRNGSYTHAARRLPTGKWTSKLGELEDIEHDAPDDVAGDMYGEVVAYMRRPVG